jgi:hypothetical protein
VNVGRCYYRSESGKGVGFKEHMRNSIVFCHGLLVGFCRLHIWTAVVSDRGILCTAESQHSSISGLRLQEPGIGFAACGAHIVMDIIASA